jgi:prepilin-type processing-associated H-X9-DG protein
VDENKRKTIKGWIDKASNHLDTAREHLKSPRGMANAYLGVAETDVGSPRSGCLVGPYRFMDGRRDDPCSRYHFWSMHPGGGNFLFADGAVHFLSYSAEPVMPALATRAGGEAVAVP